MMIAVTEFHSGGTRYINTVAISQIRKSEPSVIPGDANSRLAKAVAIIDIIGEYDPIRTRETVDSLIERINKGIQHEKSI